MINPTPIGDMEHPIHVCSSECPDSKVFEPHEYQLKEAQRKILLKRHQMNTSSKRVQKDQ